MEALLDLEAVDHAITDPDLAADASTGRVDIQMVIDAADPAVAMVKALATLRAAIHAIGDATQGWEAMTGRKDVPGPGLPVRSASDSNCAVRVAGTYSIAQSGTCPICALIGGSGAYKPVSAHP